MLPLILFYVRRSHMPTKPASGEHRIKSIVLSYLFIGGFGGADRDRTDDLLNAILKLSASRPTSPAITSTQKPSILLRLPVYPLSVGSMSHHWEAGSCFPWASQAGGSGMKFTKATIAKLTVPAGKSELIVFDEDMPGFGLRLRAGGSAVWIAQYRVGAKQRRVTLGRTATLDPDRARRAAREVLAKADLGQDAQAERRDRQAKAAVTFGAVAQLYLKRVATARKPRTQSEARRHIDRDWKPFHGRHPAHRRECQSAGRRSSGS